MKKLASFFFLLGMYFPLFAQLTPFEKSGQKQTATYEEVIHYYEILAKAHPQSRLLTYGLTDSGQPLHLFVLSKDKDFSPESIRKKNKRVLLINNGIHPGEPEGIDASMMLARDLLKSGKLPEHVVLCIIPVYNVDGSLNRGTTRANQNGPESYGFRGNARNYDLNRDFIKSDSKNSRSFQLIFQTWQPEIFVDTHTSNGADYQYTMTLIPTQKDKLNPILSTYLTKNMLPDLYSHMEEKGFELIPYVNAAGDTPLSGISGFMESPRYSTGYAALHNVIGFMPETHMLKPYDLRVSSTYKLLETYVFIVNRDHQLIGENKKQADAFTASQTSFPLSWKLNREHTDSLSFKGYPAKYKPSEVSGLQRLYYDRNEPYTKTIRWYDHFEPVTQIQKPVAYLIPQAWSEVIDLLKLNGVQMSRLNEEQEIAVTMYYIGDYKTSARPYEGHYLHSDVQLQPTKQRIRFSKGDYVIYVNQPKNRYIIETLEPQAVDSFFNWNFFDSVLGQKEHFSSYVFEDTAAELLKNNPDLRDKLENEKQKNPEMAKNANLQLNFIYKNSSYYEPTFMRYPIGRLEHNQSLK